jgi:hypothetical protein
MTTSTCQQCLATLPRGAKLCPRCGHVAPPAPPESVPDAPASAQIEPARVATPGPLAGRWVAVMAALVAFAILLAVIYASC